MKNNVQVSYEKVYTDDSGKHAQNIFGKWQEGVYFSYKQLWGGVVDGFFKCTNAPIIITATEGNIRIVVADGSDLGGYKFEEYYLSELDGKVIKISANIKYAIQNMNQDKSSFLVGSYRPDLEFEFSSNRIFNWRKKQP